MGMSEVYPEAPLGSPASASRARRLEIQEAAPVVRVLSGASPELAAAMAEARTVRDGYAQLCDYFGPSPQSGMSARISLTMLNRHRVKAGLPELRLSPREERPDPLIKALDEAEQLHRERDEARAELARIRAQLATTQAIARALQALAGEIIGKFGPYGSRQDWQRAYSTADELARWRRTAGLDGSAALGDGGTT